MDADHRESNIYTHEGAATDPDTLINSGKGKCLQAFSTADEA